MHKKIALEVFDIEVSALNFVASKIDSKFDEAVQKIINSKGRVTVCGMGKSGHIGKKSLLHLRVRVHLVYLCTRLRLSMVT